MCQCKLGRSVGDILGNVKLTQHEDCVHGYLFKV